MHRADYPADGAFLGEDTNPWLCNRASYPYYTTMSTWTVIGCSSSGAKPGSHRHSASSIRGTTPGSTASASDVFTTTRKQKTSPRMPLPERGGPSPISPGSSVSIHGSPSSPTIDAGTSSAVG